MKFDSALVKAKTFMTTESDVIGKIESAVYPATEEMKVLIGRREFSRYYNTPDALTIKSITIGDLDGSIFLEVNEKASFLEMDDILITGTENYDGYYEIDSIIDGKICIFADYVIPGINDEPIEGVVEICPLNTYTTAHAWMICYFTTFTAQEIKKNKVLITAEQFGEGNIKSFTIKDISEQRAEYLRNAYILVGKVEVRDK